MTPGEGEQVVVHVVLTDGVDSPLDDAPERAGMDGGGESEVETVLDCDAAGVGVGVGLQWRRSSSSSDGEWECEWSLVTAALA
mmetsp:Transcript_22273/g.35752  ORF Transcript_22273/g.35752 Transcript_22273/m.35752 type:complete len:83 (-) Transcript_22273:141-389(-)